MRRRFFLLTVSLLGVGVGTLFSQQTNLSDLSEQADSSNQQTDSLRIITVQEIEVSAVRLKKHTPMAFTDIGKKEIEEQNFGQDMPFLLSMTPSLISTSDAGAGVGYTGVRIRGTDPTRINVTTNGVPMNEAESHSLFWVNMPDMASSLSEIQVQRGAGSSTNGAGAFGGSIAMITEPLQEKPYGEISLGGGSYGTIRGNAKFGTGLMGDHWIISGRVSAVHSDGYIKRASADMGSYFFQAGYFNGPTMLKFLSFGGMEETYHAWNGVDDYRMAENRRYNSCGEINDKNGDFTGKYYDNQVDNYRQIHNHLVFSHEISNRWSINSTLHYTDGYGYYEEYKNSEKLIEFGIGNDENKESNLIRRKGMDNWFAGGIVGANYKTKNLDLVFGGAANHYDGDHIGTVLSVIDLVDVKNKEYYNNVGKKSDANIYAKLNWQPIKKLNIYADMQLRHINYAINGTNDKWDSAISASQVLAVDENYTFFNPKAGVYYSITDKSSIYGSFAVAQKEPTRNNFTDAKTDVTPRPEKMYDYELGYTFRSPKVGFGVNLYYMKYIDQLILTGEINQIGELLADNVPDSYRAGVELTLNVQFAKWLRWQANAAFSSNKILDYTAYVDDYDTGSQREVHFDKTTISFSPSILAASLLEFSKWGFSAALQTNYVGKQYLTNLQDEKLILEDYCVTNLRLHYTFPLFGKQTTVGVAINNIFSKLYSSNGWGGSYYAEDTLERYAGYYPQAPINVLANFTIKF